MDIKEDKQQPFNKPLALYNKVLGGLEDKVIILKVKKIITYGLII